MQVRYRLWSWGLVLPALCLFFVACLPAAGAHGQGGTGDATGTWRTEDGVSIVEITPCGTSLCGHLVAFPPIAGDPSANAALCNLQILGGFHRGRDGRWVDGWVAAVEADEIYQASITVISPARLELRAYVGNERRGETVTWTRHAGAIDCCRVRR